MNALPPEIVSALEAPSVAVEVTPFDRPPERGTTLTQLLDARERAEQRASASVRSLALLTEENLTLKDTIESLTREIAELRARIEALLAEQEENEPEPSEETESEDEENA